MTSLEMRPTFDSTSAAGAMPIRQMREPVLVGCMLVGLGTSTAHAAPNDMVWHSQRCVEQTTAGAVVASAQPAGAAIGELRRLSGLTWDQLARIFSVSRRSLHFWASGKPMAPSNEEHLQRVLAVVRKIDRGSASANRAALLAGRENGLLPFDLLVAKEYDRVGSLLGEGEARRAPLSKLSREARAARAPRPPEELVGALQDSIHRDSGAFRAARSVRVRSGR
jgi:DNA-binding transcriptional regulator YiaG